MSWSNLVRIFLQEEYEAKKVTTKKKGATNSNSYPLHYAILDEDFDKVWELVNNNPELVAQLNDKNESPLHWACRSGVEKIVELLLKKLADVNVRDNNGNTPLHWAALHNRDNVALLLLQHDAKAYSKNNINQSPHQLALLHESFKFISSMLQNQLKRSVQ